MDIQHPNRTDKIRVRDYVHFILVIVMIAWKVMPMFSYTLTGITWSVAYHLVFGIWVIVAVTSNKVWDETIENYMGSFLLWIWYLIFIFIVYPNTQAGFLSLCLSFWEPAVIYYYYSKIYDRQSLKKYIIIVAALIICIALFQSIRSVQVNALAAREASSGHTSEDSILTGNYAFTAMITLLTPMAIAVCIKSKNLLVKFIALVFILGSVFFVFKCSLTISMLCMVLTLCLFLMFVLVREMNGKSIALITTLCILLSIFFLNIQDILISILDVTESFIGSTIVSERIATMRVFILTGNMVGDLQGRLDLSFLALKTFIQHPVLGIGPQNNADIYFRTQLGMHATLFDDFARYGVVGMFFYLRAFNEFRKYSLSKISGISVQAFKCGYIIYFVISMLNPTISAEIGFALFFIMPTIGEWLSEKEEI